MHIHAEKDNKAAKFNLEFIELVRSNKFNAKELKTIRKLVEENAELFKNKWNEFYDNN